MSAPLLRPPAPDGVSGQTPAWDCPACGAALSVAYMRATGRHTCGGCGGSWGADLFRTVRVHPSPVCPRCGILTMTCDCCDPPICRCGRCGWDAAEVRR